MKTALSAALLAPWFCVAALAADPGAAGLFPGCEKCHGENGISVNPTTPIIAGQPEPLIANAHEQFKDWARPCPNSDRDGRPLMGGGDSMCSVSASLDTTTINAIAAHYAKQPFRPARQSFDTGLAVVGAGVHQMYCESCHPEGGSRPGYAGRLAGQWTPYLRRALRQVAQQELRVPSIMQHKLSQFSDEEIEALLNFWASQQE